MHRANDPAVPSNVDIVLYEHGPPRSGWRYRFRRGRIPEARCVGSWRQARIFHLALARQFPAFRKPVVEHIIQKVSRENALFAVATALPNVVPNLIELPWAFGEFASDTAFLTANQMRMAFLIAAACGKEIGLSHQKGAVLSIAAGAFGWRALARELVGKIPLGGGLIPERGHRLCGNVRRRQGPGDVLPRQRRATRAQRESMYQAAYERGKSIAEAWKRARVARDLDGSE